MGLPAPVAELIFAEHVYRPIRGNVGFLAHQNTILTPESLAWLSQKYQVPMPAGFQIELSRDPHMLRHYPGSITDRTLLRYLGIDSPSFIDVSDYEGADVICDLSHPIPSELRGRFDFIFDGSCLDNISNVFEALTNVSRLLRPGGRAVIMEHATHMNGAYLAFTPGWFYDYFCANGYRDCKVYLGMFRDDAELHFGPWQLFHLNPVTNPVGAMPQLVPDVHAMLVVIAEKDDDSTDEASPIQGSYRVHNAEAMRVMEQKQQRILSSSRPFWGSSRSTEAEKKRMYPRLENLGEDIPFVNGQPRKKFDSRWIVDNSR